MTELEIRDPDPTPGGDPEATSGELGPDGPESPYRNLLVPLVVVPALIVMVLVLVFVLFGAVAGSEATPAENVERILSGGANEREQAAFNLVRQVLEDEEAAAAGRAAEWGVDASLAPRLRRAWEENQGIEDRGDAHLPLAVAAVLVRLGEVEGVEYLAELTRLPESVDPEREVRWHAAVVLGKPYAALGEEGRALAARTLIDLTDDPDPGIRVVAAAGLQNRPSPETAAALVGLLGDADLAVRGTAALSLEALGDASGVAVLRSMLDPGSYERDRGQQPGRWPAALVSESRRRALEALDRLGQAPSGEELARLARDDDPLVRELAMRLQER